MLTYTDDQKPPLSSSMPKKNGKRMQLPGNFVPGKYAVLCGRGGKCTKSTGNQRLKALIQRYLRPYSEAKNKIEKSAIVSTIISTIKKSSSDGAFIKFKDGAWYEVEDAFAREKIGCLFRDALHTQYRSSTKAKLARKKAQLTDGDACSLNSSNHSSNHSSLNSSTGSCHSSNSNSNSNSHSCMNSSSHSRMSSSNHSRMSSSNHSHMNSSNHSRMNSNNQSRMNTSNHSYASTRTKDIFQQATNHPITPYPILSQQQSHQQQQQQQQQHQPHHPVKKDLNDYCSLLSSYLNDQGARPTRPDFVRDCMPVSLPSFQKSSRKPNSLLQEACNLVGGNDDDLMEDFPDDISDIFEENV